MFELVPHIADVRLRVASPTLEELFGDAMRGMYAVMHDHVEDRQSCLSVTRSLSVHDSADTTSLLVDFLNEVLHRAHVARERFESVTFTRFDAASLDAELTGIAPASFDEDVKAATYHEADVRCEEGVWTTMLVFDI